MIAGGGFNALNGSGGMTPPFGRGAAPGGSVGPVSAGVQTTSPNTTPPAAAPAPKVPIPYGQANDPAAYGTPGAPSSSPLGVWQSWLNSMGPYLAQQPFSQPNAESGGLSSLAPSASGTGPGIAGYAGAGGGAPWQGRRGFSDLML